MKLNQDVILRIRLMKIKHCVVLSSSFCTMGGLFKVFSKVSAANGTFIYVLCVESPCQKSLSKLYFLESFLSFCFKEEQPC